ncbi:hypothetical protein HHK36_015973 [Tetracentron sinense]|uniref:RING-type E3 ubiquitin transferase n=1 Tax=Tetracentron sinense TaxID=13715 RepID=A0A835DDB1_TETSI|nr:hypothetical protein HHK36_015973 [Tetracentron sinense]
MDFDIGIQDVALAVQQELWNKVAFGAMDLANEIKDVTLENDSFREFSKYISELNLLIQALNNCKIEATTCSQGTRAALETLNSQLRNACNLIKDYKCWSRLRLLLNSHSVLSRMQDIAKEIAETLSSLQLANLDVALNVKSKTDQIINNLRSMEFRSAAATETIVSDIEKSMTQNGRNREHAIKLLQKIAETTGATANASLVRNELALLKQEKEEMEAQKKQAEALQLSQLIQLLYSTELVTTPREDEIRMYPIDSFMCPLCDKMMTDPVAIACGHSFERNAIQEHFDKGQSTCPTCKQELPTLELTANLSVRSSIEQWKQRDTELKFQTAVSGITSDDHSILNEALEDMQVLMEMPRHRAKVAGLIPNLVEVLKDTRLNTKAALKCLHYLSNNSDENKEAIVEAGAIHCIVKQFYKGEAEPDAVGILLELSVRETLAEKIGNAKDCIPLLVSLLQNNNSDVSQKAQKVLQNLSSNTDFVVKMAEAGQFKPFVARFNQGPRETRCSMAAAVIKMQINGNSISDLENKQFIHNLVQMLSSSTPACVSACLQSIKKLSAYPNMVKQFLEDPATIPSLCLISFVRPEPQWRQEATKILTSLVKSSQLYDFQTYQGLKELESQHNVSLVLQIAATSDPQTKVHFLQLLVELSYKSETARNLVRSDEDAVARLFTSLNGEQPEVRQVAMRLIYCISEGHPAGVPLPPSPAKEFAIKTLAAILTSSPEIQERSTAAGIISQLPTDDIMVDEILHKSEALKAIHEVICAMDDELSRFKTPNDLSEAESLLENALAALLRYTEPTKPELQRQVGKLELYPSLVRVLSRGSSLAKERTAMALTHLSQSTTLSLSFANATIMPKHPNNNSLLPLLQLSRLFTNMSNWCCSASARDQSLCPVHGGACSSRHTFCLVKADAVRPLLQTLSETQSGAAEAALMALDTLLMDHRTLPHAAAAIVEGQGMAAILQVLEKGSSSAKDKALDIFQKILNHTQITDPLSQRSERILIQLLQDDTLKKKTALVLRQMNLIPDQSSYF